MAIAGEARTRSLAEQFYGVNVPGARTKRLVCITTMREVFQNPDLHHLDENKTHWNILNVVPLRRDLNQAIDSRETAGLPPEVQPATLATTSRHWFHLGRFPQAYGCNRLACHWSGPQI